jgi:hypothetical protein
MCVRCESVSVLVAMVKMRLKKTGDEKNFHPHAPCSEAVRVVAFISDFAVMMRARCNWQPLSKTYELFSVP